MRIGSRVLPAPRSMNRQKRIWLWTPGKTLSSFSKSYRAASWPFVTTSLKKNCVVASVAIPVGTITPVRPRGPVRTRSVSVKTAYVLMSPRPVSGKRALTRKKWLSPSARRLAASNSAYRRAPSRSSRSSVMSRLRAEAFLAPAIRGSRWAKNSCSWSLTRSHGGLPTTASNPPAQPVPGWTPVPVSGTANTSGNSRCQWKKRYCSRNSRISAWVVSGTADWLRLRNARNTWSVGASGAPSCLGQTKAAHQASAACTSSTYAADSVWAR